MIFRVAWWRDVCPLRWRSADVAASAQHQQRQLETSNATTVSLARLRLLELTGNNAKSPFHGCHYFLLLLSSYLALIVGGIIALPWLMLRCWSTWGFRMICFSWGGLANVFDVFCLPSAVSAFQQRSRQKRVRKELRKRLRAALKGLDIAAFLGGDNVPDSNSDARTSSTHTSSESNYIVRGGSSSTKALQPPTDIPLDCNSHTDTCQGRQGQQEQQNEFQGIDEGNRDAAEESPKTVRRRSTRLLQQHKRQEAPNDSAYSSKNIGGVAPQKTHKSPHNFPDTRSSGDSEHAGHTTLASVKEELQHADILRKQRAAAAAEASAAANARRLGLATLADCQRLAGKAAITDEDIAQLLEKAHVEPEILSFSGAAAAGRQKRSLGIGSWLARICRFPFSACSRSLSAGSTSVFSTTFPYAAASAAPSGSDIPSTSRSCAIDGNAIGDPTAAGVLPAPVSMENRRSAESRLTVEATKTAWSSSGIGDSREKGHGGLSCATAAHESCSATGASFQYGNSSGTIDSSCSVSSLSGSCSGKQIGIKNSSSVSTSSSSVGIAGGNSSSRQPGEGAAKDVLADAHSRADERRKDWKSLVPWQLIFRGLIAHIQCTYIVDLLFCHAQLSPLSDSIQRIVLLVLHCLIRGLTIFLAFASPYAHVPYSSLLLSRHLVYSLFMCMAASFGSATCLLLVPVFIEDVLQPLLRFLLLPESLVASDALLLFVDLRLMLPSVPANYNGTTWDGRMDFYAACQIVSLAVVAVGAYTAARLYDAEPRAAAAAKRVYAKDVLTLLALREREQALDGASGEVSAVVVEEVGNQLGDQYSPETVAAPSPKKEGCEVREGTTPVNKGFLVAASVDISRESLLEKRTADGVSSCGGKGKNSHQIVLRPVTKDAEATPGRLYEEDEQQQPEWTKHEQIQLRKQQEAMKEDRRLSLLLAEKVIDERVYLEGSDFELLRTRVLKRILFVAVAVATSCLLLCWATVAFLAVSNVAMRVNTASDILQERDNVQLMTAVAAAVALFDDQAEEGFQDWAEEIRLLQEELRDVVAYYRKVQQERGWLAATLELWEKLREEFTAAGEVHKSRRKQEVSAYAVLGVKPSATGADIKKAYKILAKQLHPDILAAVSDKPATPEELDVATERMRQINAAYEKLMRKHGGRAGKSNS